MPESDSPSPPPEGEPGPKRRSGRQLAIVAALVVGLLVGGTVAVLLVDDDAEDAASPTTSSTPEGPTTTVEGRTVPGPESPTTSTPPTTAVGSGGMVTTSPATTAAPTSGSCGNGSVRVEPEPGAISQDGSGYHMPVGAAVTSQFDQPVEVTRLVVRVSFEDGSTTDVEIDTAGVAIPPGDSHIFDGPTIDSESKPTTTSVAELAYQTADRPDCEVSS